MNVDVGHVVLHIILLDLGVEPRREKEGKKKKDCRGWRERTFGLAF